MGQLGANRLARAGPEATEGTGVHPASRLIGVDEATGVGDEIAAIADDDRVTLEHFAQLFVDPHRVQRRAPVVELIPLDGALLLLDLAQLRQPGAGAALWRTERLADRRQAGGDATDEIDLRRPVGD